MPLRAIVVDDSAVFRRAVSEALNSIADVEVVASAGDGLAALRRIQELAPDLVTLDMEMPGISGLEVLTELQQHRPEIKVIVVSALTRRGGQLALDALSRGAFDFITKPECSSAEASREAIRRELQLRVRALLQRRRLRPLLSRADSDLSAQMPAPARAAGSSTPRLPIKPKLVLIGVSTGGPNALMEVVPRFPATLGAPVLIVQHMPPMFTEMLAKSLAAASSLPVKEASPGERVFSNNVYIAPGGTQMRVVAGPGRSIQLDITDDPPENNCKPSVDYLFRSAAENFPGQSLAVIMTGMGNDGTAGLRLLKQQKCHVLAQDEPSCVVYGMPRAAVEAGVVDSVLPLDQIAIRIALLLGTQG